MTEAVAPALLVRGRGGLFEGVRCALRPGATLVIGRSRSCHLSLRRTRAFRNAEDPMGLLLSDAFRRVSRVHCEIAYLPDARVEIRDLSQNGTLIDGRRIDRTRVLAPGDRPVRLVVADAVHGALVISFGPCGAAPQ